MFFSECMPALMLDSNYTWNNMTSECIYREYTVQTRLTSKYGWKVKIYENVKKSYKSMFMKKESYKTKTMYGSPSNISYVYLYSNYSIICYQNPSYFWHCSTCLMEIVILVPYQLHRHKNKLPLFKIYGLQICKLWI